MGRKLERPRRSGSEHHSTVTRVSVTRVTFIIVLGWIVLLYRLPSNESRARVAVWRELRRSGALHLQQSVVVVPDADAFAGVVERLRTVILDVGGEVTAIRGAPLADGDESRILQAWNAARDDEYRELAGECAKFVDEIDHEFKIQKFTLAELDEEEAELDKLQRWHQRIRARDVRDAAGADAAGRALQKAGEALERYSRRRIRTQTTMSRGTWSWPRCSWLCCCTPRSSSRRSSAAGARTPALRRLVPDCTVLFRRLLADDRVRRRGKLVLAALIAYLAMLIYIIRDFISIAGQLHDAIIVAVGSDRFRAPSGPLLSHEHWPGRQASLHAMNQPADGNRRARP